MRKITGEQRKHEIELLFDRKRPEVPKFSPVVESETLTPVPDEEPIPDLFALRKFGQKAVTMCERNAHPIEQRDGCKGDRKNAQGAPGVERRKIVGGAPRRDKD